MRRGRKPKPTELKILEGNPGQRRLPDNEPKPDPGMPEPPGYLCEMARQEWDARGPGLVRMKILSPMDMAVFAAYCQAFADCRRAREALNLLMKNAQEGLSAGAFLAQSKVGGPRRNPLLLVANDAELRMVRYATELGMTPSARVRLAISPADESESRFRALLYHEKK